MIVKNEEASLPRCLQSVEGVVDELVVVDTGSSDRTVAIAQELGAKVHHYEWCNDFSAARNAALQYVQGDWVLVLDADEVLVPEIVPALKQAIASETHLVINLMRQEVGATQSPYSLVSRLFRRHPEICFSRPYHALIDESVDRILQQQSHWQVGYLPDVAILHYGYQTEAIAARRKAQTAQTAMASFLAQHPDEPYVCSKLGALYVQLGEVQRGIDLLQRGLKSEQADAQVLYELHYHLGIALSRLGQTKTAMSHYQLALQQPIPPRLKLGAYTNWGNLLKEAGDLSSAKQVYQQVLEIDPTFAPGHYNLGMTLRALGNLPSAIAAYHEAIRLQPNYAEAHQNLGVALLKLGKVPDSLAAFRQAIALLTPKNSAEAERLRQGLMAMGFQI